MKIKINDNELELVYSFRSSIYFEQITKKNIDFTDFNSNDLLTLFYCVVLASLQKAKLDIITFNDFMDVVDDNGGEQCLLQFSNWYVKVIGAQYELLNYTNNDEQEDKKEKKASKKKS